VDELARRRVLRLRLRPRFRGVAAIELGGGDAKLLAGGGQLALGDRQQPIDAQADALLEPELLLELLRPSRKEARAFGASSVSSVST
jgi:hypothetical protein